MRSPLRGRARTWLAVVAVTAALGGAAALRPVDPQGQFLTVHRDDFVLTVPVSGTLAAVATAHIGAPQIDSVWQFKIVFMAPEGATVHRGQPVLAFDPSDLERMLQSAQVERDEAARKLDKRSAELATSRVDAELSLAEAQADHRRAELEVEGVPPELKKAHELASARADLALANRKLANYRGRLEDSATAGAAETRVLTKRRDTAAGRVAQIESAIAHLRIGAPRDGTVVYFADQRGEKRKIGDSCSRFMTVMEIPDLRRMRADGEISEADAGRAAAGQRVALRLDAHPDSQVTGRIRSIAGAIQKRSDNSPLRVVRLDIELDQTDRLKMRPGMHFTGTVEVGRTRGVLLVPLDAVQALPTGPVVFRLTRFGVEVVHPRLGRHNEHWVEVLAGLAAGNRLRPATATEESVGTESGSPAAPAGVAAKGPF